MSLVCGSRAEREKARPDTVASAGGERECPSRDPVGTGRDLSTVAGDAPADQPVVVVKPRNKGGAKGLGRPWLLFRSVNRDPREELRGRAESI